jgi:uncharacterized protein with HEPN domain
VNRARRSPLQRLHDLLEAVSRIENFTAGRTFEQFVDDKLLRDAVERNIERLSEASRHLPEAMKAAHGNVPWRAVADVGNVLRHAYDEVDPRQVWQIVTDDLAPLKTAVLAMIAATTRDR